MKKLLMFFSFLLFILSPLARATSTQDLYNTYVEVRTAVRAGNFDALEGIAQSFLATNPDFRWLLQAEHNNERTFDLIAEDLGWILNPSGEGNIIPHTPNEAINDVVFNIGLLGMAGPQVQYFIQEAGITNVMAKNLIRILSVAVQKGYIADKRIEANERAQYINAAVSAIVAAAESSHWQHQHEDSYNYDSPQLLVPVFAVMTEEFGFYLDLDNLSDEVKTQLQQRNLGADELWQEPLDIIGEVVRRSHHLQNSLYKAIDPRDYFFYIQDHFARVFGAEDVDYAAEFAVKLKDGVRQVLMVCNANFIQLTPGPTAHAGHSKMMTTVTTTWEEFKDVKRFTCGDKVYEVRTGDNEASFHAPEPRIVRPGTEHADGFNVALSYVYFSDMPQEVVENLITGMEEEGGFTYDGEEAIEDSVASLKDAISEADMFYRIGHVQGTNMNISFTRGRELKFHKNVIRINELGQEEVMTVRWRVQIPGVEHSGFTSLSREDLAEALWARSENGRTQSLFAMGIACRSASYINTWMSAYFEAVINNIDEVNIDEDGSISDFDPPFVIGATNTFDSNVHRQGQEGLNSFLQIILISMNHAIHPNPAFNDQAILRDAMYTALAANETPYNAESNHDLPHTRSMTSRTNIILRHEDEVIDRVFN